MLQDGQKEWSLTLFPVAHEGHETGFEGAQVERQRFGSLFRGTKEMNNIGEDLMDNVSHHN